MVKKYVWWKYKATSLCCLYPNICTYADWVADQSVEEFFLFDDVSELSSSMINNTPPSNIAYTVAKLLYENI